MSLNLEAFYNLFLNITIPVKIVIYVLTFCIIFFYTPNSMKVFAKFLCNLLFWDFSTHVLWLGFHAFPMMPRMCFRLDGFLASFYFNELLGHIFFSTFFINTVNASIAIFLSFQFRLLMIKYGQLTCKNMKIYIYGYCIGLHLLVTSVLIGLYTTWPLNVDSHPDSKLEENLFCYKPRAMESQVFILFFIAFLVLVVIGITAFVALSFREVNKNRNLIGEKTAKMQKVFLGSLIFLSGFPINIGGIPCIIMCVVFYFPEVPNAQLIVVICFLVASIHGPIMCVSTLILFKPYRTPILRFVKKMSRFAQIGPLNCQNVTVVNVSVKPHHLRYIGISRLIAVVAILSQLKMISVFLCSVTYAFQVMRYERLADWQSSGLFPRVTLCGFDIRVPNQYQKYTMECTLPIFVFLFFYLPGLALFTVVNIGYWIWLSIFPLTLLD